MNKTKRVTLLLRLLIGPILTPVSAQSLSSDATVPVLTGPVRQTDGSVAIAIHGGAGQAVVLQGSSDMKSWADVETFQLSGAPITFQQAKASQVRHQYFRLKSADGLPAPTLQNLAELPNAVFPAGEGFDTIQFAPNDTLGFIFWDQRELKIRERSTAGAWREETISANGNLIALNASRHDYKFQPAALLLYDGDSAPHIFQVSGSSTISHWVRKGGGWTEQESLNNPAANASLALLAGALGPNNTFHLAAVSAGESPNVSYGSNSGGAWRWTAVSPAGGLPRYFLQPSYAPRWFALAVDSNNAAHLVFRPSFTLNYNGPYGRPYNELAYASNKSGQWNVEIIQRPLDESGEAGNGMSIAIGPDNHPAIASWYNERGDGGSAQASRLFYQTQDAAGKWTKTEVISRPDGYIAGDDEKGAGFAPYLRFDGQGRPHILFSDHGSEHFELSGQSEFAGQIRHAVLRNDWKWEVETLFRQTDPKRQQIIYPAFAMNGSELAVIGLQRLTDWNWSVYPPSVNSTYKFLFLTSALR